jgi:hypothetical protein
MDRLEQLVKTLIVTSGVRWGREQVVKWLATIDTVRGKQLLFQNLLPSLFLRDHQISSLARATVHAAELTLYFSRNGSPRHSASFAQT